MVNWYKLKRALLTSSTVFGLTGLLVLGACLSAKYWFGPIVLFGAIFIGTTLLFYIFD